MLQTRTIKVSGTGLRVVPSAEDMLGDTLPRAGTNDAIVRGQENQNSDDDCVSGARARAFTALFLGARDVPDA